MRDLTDIPLHVTHCHSFL